MKKLKAIIGVLASSLMLGAAVGISTINNNQEARPVEAGSNNFKIVGQVSSLGLNSFSYASGVAMQNGGDDNKALYTGLYLTQGDVFKLTDNSSWLGYNNKDGSCVGTTYLFVAAQTNKILNCGSTNWSGATTGTWGEEGSTSFVDYEAAQITVKVNVDTNWAKAGARTDIEVYKDGAWKAKWFGSGDKNAQKSSFSFWLKDYHEFEFRRRNGDNINDDWGAYTSRYNTYNTLCGDGNFYVRTSGYYDVYVNNSSKVYIEYHGDTGYGVTSKHGIYADLSGGTFGNWNMNTSKLAVKFIGIVGGSTSAEIWSDWMKAVSGETSLYEVEVPRYNNEIVTWRMVILQRNDNSAVSPGHTSSNSDQTPDLWFTGTGYQLIKTNTSDGGGWKTGATLENTYGDTERAERWGTNFLATNTCSGSGSIVTSNWSASQTDYDNAAKEVQGIIWLQTGASTGTNLAKAVYRYDYIVFFKQYSGYSDFIHRGNSGSGKTLSAPSGILSLDLIANSQNGTSTLIIIIVSIVSVTAVGGYFFLRKRKQER